MKNIKNLLVLMIAIFAISCSTDDVEDRPVIEPIGTPMLLAPDEGNIYNLTFEQKDNLVERFVWSDADFGGDVEITYNVQIDNAGNDFANAESLGSIIGASQLGVSVETLNNTVLALGATPFQAATYEVRVKSIVGEMEMNSDIKTITVSPFTTEAPKMYVTGNFPEASGYAANWSPENGIPLAASEFGATDFEGFIYMNVDQPMFKFLPTNIDWTGDYGDAGDSDGSYTEVLKQDGEVNAGTPDGTGGYFYVQANTEDLTYSLQETNWGVIGDATPTLWDSDTDMTYDAENKVWTVTLDLIQKAAPDSGIKFRSNDTWEGSPNLGDTGADGTLEYGGSNIGVPEDGNYTITLNLSNPRMYTYTLTKN
jgi:starch-binding outer membrane protein SusE/F